MSQTRQRPRGGRLRIPVVVGAAGFLVALTGGIVQTAGAHEVAGDGTARVAETLPPWTDPSIAQPPDPSLTTDPNAGPFTVPDPCAASPGAGTFGTPTPGGTVDPGLPPTDPGTTPGGLGATPDPNLPAGPTVAPSDTGAPVIIPPGMNGSTPIATPGDTTTPAGTLPPAPGDTTMPTGGAAGTVPTPADTTSVQPGTNPWPLPGDTSTGLPGVNSTPVPGDTTSATPVPGDTTSATPVPGSTPSCASVPVPIPTDSVVPIPTVG
ncbi:hypothetical protein [Dactylosporangium sp. NPDC000521]|uniref:hypothetical protein n=1 Tax=Dactylosporangium sp. NPDC000521 TaxID=3363975 RepID=UPI00368A783E